MNDSIGLLSGRVEHVLSVAIGKGFKHRLGNCEEGVERLYTLIGGLCTFLGITENELEPVPSRRELSNNPDVEQYGTNTYYPRWSDRGVGTFDDTFSVEMHASAYNPRPVPQAPWNILSPLHEPSSIAPPDIVMETDNSPIPSPLTPIPEAPTPPDSSSEEEFIPSDLGVRLSAGRESSPAVVSAVELGSKLPSGLVSKLPSAPEMQPALPLTVEPSPESAPNSSLPVGNLPSTLEQPVRPVTPSVNLIRPTPENSQEAMVPNIVALQPAPSEASVQTAPIPLPEDHVPEPTGPPLTPATLPIPELLPRVESVLPLPTIQGSAIPVPDPPSPDATVRDLSRTLPEPVVSRKRKRASSVRPSRSVQAGLGVPASGARTRSTSLAATVRAGPRTRSLSRSRSPSLSSGEKRQRRDS